MKIIPYLKFRTYGDAATYMRSLKKNDIVTIGGFLYEVVGLVGSNVCVRFVDGDGTCTVLYIDDITKPNNVIKTKYKYRVFDKKLPLVALDTPVGKCSWDYTIVDVVDNKVIVTYGCGTITCKLDKAITALVQIKE